jgi:hypothetical protein
MERAGYTHFATNIALESLQQGDYLKLGRSFDETTDEEGAAAFLTDKGKKWLLDNQDALLQPRLIHRAL